MANGYIDACCWEDDEDTKKSHGELGGEDLPKSICYGDAVGSIFTDGGKERLWDEENVVYQEGVHALRVEYREGLNPFIILMTEDDGCLKDSGVCFDAGWLKDLRNLIDATIEKIK